MWTDSRSSTKRAASGARADVDNAPPDAAAEAARGLLDRTGSDLVREPVPESLPADLTAVPATSPADVEAPWVPFATAPEPASGRKAAPIPTARSGSGGVQRTAREAVAVPSGPDTTLPGQVRLDGPVIHASGDTAPAGDEAGTLAVESGGTSLDVEALRESMALAEKAADQLAKEFYSQLFAQNPELRELFPAGMQVQRSRLVGALVRIIGSLDDRTELVPYLKGLGRDHRKFGVINRHYGSVGSALIRAMRKVFGEDWTPRYESAWIEAYDTVALVMVHGADEDAVILPPWWDAEVVFHRRVLDDVAVIQVRPHTTFPYRPGQYCSLTTPRRPKMWRSYSMATAPRDDGLLEFHVRAIGAGWVSSALVWRTEPGDILQLGAPQGNDLANPRSERDLLCICGGTGIAPVLAGLQELEQRQDGRRVHVFYAGRDRDRLYALPHLESIGVRYRRLTVVPVVSPEGPEDRSPDVMGNVVSSYGDWRRHDVFVSGHTNMVQTTLDRLRQQGIPEHQVVYDDYGVA